MRRFDEQGLLRLDTEHCWRFLERHRLGRVGLARAGQPMVFPVHYVVDGESVVFRTSPGTKLMLAAKGAQVVLEVDEADELFETGASVVLHGRMHEVTDPREVERLRRLPLHPWAPGDRDHFVRIEAEHLTGREITPHLVGDALDVDGG